MLVADFDWDEANREKSLKHGVTWQEAEECFLNRHFVFESKKEALAERRWLLLGESIGRKKLAVVFTLRADKARVISARPMSRKERRFYEEKKNVSEASSEVQIRKG